MSGLPNQSTTPHDHTGRSLPCTRHELRIKLENDACHPPLYSQNKRTKLAPNLNPFSRRVSRTHMVTVVFDGYIQYQYFSEKCKKSYFLLGAIPESFKTFIAPHTGQTSMCVDMDEIDPDPVVEEETHEYMVCDEDSSAIPRHQQLLPFPHHTDANKERMKGISDKYLSRNLCACGEHIVVVCCFVLLWRAPVTLVAGPIFETKNRAIFLERFSGRGILGEALLPLQLCSH